MQVRTIDDAKGLVSHAVSQMTESQRLAIDILKDATRGSCDPWDMAGPAKSDQRAAFVRNFTGAKVPKAKCGVSEIERLLMEYFTPAGEHKAARVASLKSILCV